MTLPATDRGLRLTTRLPFVLGALAFGTAATVVRPATYAALGVVLLLRPDRVPAGGAGAPARTRRPAELPGPGPAATPPAPPPRSAVPTVPRGTTRRSP